MYDEKDFKPYDRYGSRATLKKTEIALSKKAEICSPIEKTEEPYSTKNLIKKGSTLTTLLGSKQKKGCLFTNIKAITVDEILRPKYLEIMSGSRLIQYKDVNEIPDHKLFT